MQSFDNQQISERLIQALDMALPGLRALSEADWNYKPAPEKWSRLEILGHLIDSAANNHLRFVRAQLAETELVSFAYEQNFFVSAQNYKNYNSFALINFWESYNRHMAWVMANADPAKLNVVCKIGNYEPVSLGFIMNDYVDHLNHHLQAIIT